MTSPTHLAFSGFLWLFISSIMGIPLNFLWLLGSCVSSLLPDVDCANSWTGRMFFFLSKRIEKRFGHRTITHSILGISIFGVILTPLYFISTTLFSACLIGYASHVLLDCLNKTGVQLFYPDGIQAVMPGRDEYRFTYAGKGEKIILFLLIGLGLLIFPIANKGLIKFIHYVRGDNDAAVMDYRDYAKEYLVWCDLVGIDALTNKPVKGRFKVVGANGSSTLIISNHGNLRTAGTIGDVNIRANKTRCVKGEGVSIVVNEAQLKDKYLENVKGYIDVSKEHYLFGVLDVDEKPVLEERIDRFSTMQYVNNKLVLEYASWDELEKLKAEDVLIKDGYVLIKTILKKGETMDVKECEGQEARDEGQMITVLVSVEDPNDVLVKEGQKIRIGEPFACIGKGELKELEVLKKELEYQGYLINKGIGSNKTRNDVLEKIEKIENEHKKMKVSRFNGVVSKVNIKGVRDGEVGLEVVLEVEKG